MQQQQQQQQQLAQQSQQQQQQQHPQAASAGGAAAAQEEEDQSVNKIRVLCVSPDEEMGFLMNLPPPCNVIIQPSTIGMSGKVPESPFLRAFERFLKGTTFTGTFSFPDSHSASFQEKCLKPSLFRFNN
jgi:hypothetical protein